MKKEKTIKQMNNKELLDYYNNLRNIVEGVVDGGFGRWELNRLLEIEREMAFREEGI